MSLKARISPRTKNAMQSGPRAGTEWELVFDAPGGVLPDPLMGWWGHGDTQSQLRMRFESREEAVAYAERNQIAYVVEIQSQRHHPAKAYADNFRFDRKENWTH